MSIDLKHDHRFTDKEVKYCQDRGLFDEFEYNATLQFDEPTSERSSGVKEEQPRRVPVERSEHKTKRRYE